MPRLLVCAAGYTDTTIPSASSTRPPRLRIRVHTSIISGVSSAYAMPQELV